MADCAVPEEHIVELQHRLDEPERLVQVDRKQLLAQAKRGDVVLLDVRPYEEFAAAHLPYARSLPLPELGH